MFDVAIVGARCAGSALALMLARAGVRVLFVDRTTFPSDTMSGHFIQPAGVSCLRRLGLFDRLEGLGYPAHDRMTLDFGPVVLSGQPAPMPDGNALAFAPRRYRFDPMLAEAATEAGAELREGTNFVEPLVEDGRVCGLVTECRGVRETIRARLLVGADGKKSRVAAHVGAAAYETRASATCAFYTYWEGADVASTRLTIRDGWFAVAMPCGPGRAFLAVQWPHARFPEVRGDVEAATRATIANAPWLAERFADARPAERFVGTGALDTFFRTASGPGWALVGDAGNHKDPVSAQGMTDALLDAELLAAAVIGELGGNPDADGGVASYGPARDRRSKPMHRVTADMSRLSLPPPPALEGLAGMAGNPDAVSAFLGVMAGSVPPPPAERSEEEEAA